MFRKRIKKEFPPGTFIPTPARVMAILQLSLALMALLWQLSDPFLGDLFATRSKMAVYEYVIGKPDGSELRQRNAARFKELPTNEQQILIDDYAGWHDKLQDSFLTKLKRSAERVLLDMPLFARLWLLLSLVLPILILMKVEGSILAAWLIPIVVFAYAVDNRWNGASPKLSPELQLFPTEEVLMTGYAQGEIDPNPFEQREQLQAAWQRYLIQEWAHEEHSADPTAFAAQVEKGEYAFTTARALAIRREHKSLKPMREGNAILVVFLLWNIAFAYVVTKYTKF